MAEKKTWRGIQINSATFQGEITSDPVFNGDYAFLTLRTIILQRDPNGQITEIDQDIPLMVEPSGPVNVVKSHIKAGRKLHATCHYKSWQAQGSLQHAFVVRKFDLGDKPYEGPASGNTPPLPG
jgi:hypothetical protein